MAIIAVPNESKFKIELDGGLDGNGKQIVKAKTFSKVKDTATNDSVYNIANSLSSLQSNSLLSIKRVDEVSLQSE